MNSYSYEDRLKVVLSVKEEHLSNYEAGRRYGPHEKDVRKWVSLYDQFGESGLHFRHGTYNGDLKLSVVMYMRDNHLSLLQTAAKFGIPSPSTVLQWDRIYTQEGAAGLYRDNRGKMKRKSNNMEECFPVVPEKETNKELEHLRAEVAYLKKLQALVEERVARESGRKQKPSKD